MKNMRHWLVKKNFLTFIHTRTTYQIIIQKTQIFIKKTCLLFIILLFAQFFMNESWSQTTTEQEITKEEEEKDGEEFVNFGYISVSKKYTLAPNGKSITYKIQNNATRSITNLYAWIYEVILKEDNNTPLYRLVNNPSVVERTGRV